MMSTYTNGTGQLIATAPAHSDIVIITPLRSTVTRAERCAIHHLLLVIDQFSPGTRFRHYTYRFCAIVSTAGFIHEFKSTIDWLLKYYLYSVESTIMHA
jgi:hypothetical protein